MSLSSRRALFSLALALLAAPYGCGVAAPAPALPGGVASASAAAKAVPPVTAAPPDGPVPQLRAGELARIDHATAIQGQVAASHADAAYETLAVTLPMPTISAWTRGPWLVVALDGDATGPHAFASLEGDGSRRQSRRWRSSGCTNTARSLVSRVGCMWSVTRLGRTSRRCCAARPFTWSESVRAAS